MSVSSTLEEYVALRSGVFKMDTTAVFIPYIVYLIDQNKYASLDDYDKILADFEEQYKFSLNPFVLRNLLAHIQQQEFVYQELGSGIYVSNIQKIRTHSFAELTKEARNSFDNLKKKCSDYITRELGIPAPTEDELVDAVFYLIQSICKAATADESDEVESPVKTAYSAVLNDFILYSEKNCPEIVDEINKLAVSDILWRVISSGEMYNVTFRNSANIFLDTRFVLRLMGLEGEYWERLTKGLTEQIKERGGKLIVFDHVKTEIEQIIRSAQTICKSDFFDITKASRVAKEFYRNLSKYTDEIISELLYNLQYNSEEAYNFSIESHGYDKDTDQFQVDYRALKENVVQEYKKTNPQFDVSECEDSIEVDVRSITMCYRARGNSLTDRLDNITVLFLTTNTAILRAAKKTKMDEAASGKIPIGMTAEYLSTFLSLGEKIDYLQANRVLMLAYCYGAVQLSKSEIKAFVKALNSERKAQHYSRDKVSYLKQSQTFARLYTINQQLPLSKRKTLEELERAKVNEYRAENKRLQQEVGEKSERIESLIEKNEELLGQIKNLKDIIEANEAKREKLKENANKYADQLIGKWQSWLTKLIAFFITAIPFALDRLIPSLNWNWIVTFWDNKGSKINLSIFIIGGTVFLVSWIIKVKPIQRWIKSVISNCYLFFHAE